MKSVRTLFLLPAVMFLCSCASLYCNREYNVELNSRARDAERPLARGEYDKSIVIYGEAYADYQKENNRLGMLLCLERTGWLQRESGQYGDALVTLKKAYPLAVELNGDAAEIDADLGDVYMFSGDFDRAKEHYQKALDSLKDFQFRTVFKRPPGKDEISTMIRKSKAIVHARVNLGTMNYFKGDYDKALGELKAAEDLIGKVEYVAGHPFYGLFVKLSPDYMEGVGFCHTMTGAVLSEKKQFDEARKHFDAGRKAFEKGRKHYGLLVNESMRFKMEFLESERRSDPDLLQRCESFLKKADEFGAIEVIWRMNYEVGRALMDVKAPPEAKTFLARSIDTLELTRSRLREDTIKQLFAASGQDVYSRMIGLCYDTGSIEEGFDYLERAKARAFLDVLAGRTLKAKSNVDPALAKKAGEIQDRIEMLGRKLKDVEGSERKAAYEEYRKLFVERKNVLEAIKSQSLEFAAATAVTTLPVSQIAARLDKDTALVSYFMDDRRTIIWVVRDGKVSATNAEAGAGVLAEMVADYREAIASRQDDLRNQLGIKLAGLLVGPVRDKIQGARRLCVVPSKSLQYLPFASLPVAKDRFLVQDHAISVMPNASCIFFGQKKKPAQRGTILALGNPKRDKEPPLEFAETEVRTVSDGFNRKDVLTGAVASESAIKNKDLMSVDVLHLAVHGKYDSKSPLSSALLLAKDDKNDGNLETFEIFSIDVNSRLVVLSACQSGIGRVEGGDDVQSLNRAFMYAGVGGVVASLWEVSDESTCRLMKLFYEGLKAQKAVDALQNAQVQLMKEYPAPYYWAAFYLSGDPEI